MAGLPKFRKLGHDAPKIRVQTASMSEYDRSSELQVFVDTKAGVKGLVEAGVAKIPRIFVHEQYILEEKTISKLSVPVIDLGCLSNDAASRGGIIDQVKAACQEWGAFKIVNHGIPTTLTNKVIEVVKEFNDLDREAKKQDYSHDFKKKVVYNSNFELYQVPFANWRVWSLFGHGS